MRISSIGFWGGPHTTLGWPTVEKYVVDPNRDLEEREFIADYLRHGVVARAYMGYSTCRVCGKTDNGDSELSDGTSVWPTGLAHYVVEHDVRLPEEFVRHASTYSESLEGDRDESWWKAAEPDW